MKYKHKLENLKAAQEWWDSQSNTFKNSSKRPGGINQTVAIRKK